MYENDWYGPASTYGDGFMLGVTLKGTSWNKAIDEDGNLDFCNYVYGPNEDLPILEVAIEGEYFLNPDDIGEFPYPHRSTDYNFYDWFSQYVQFVTDDSVQDLFRIPLKISEEDGFFAFAVGYPCGNCGMPAVEVFYATYGSDSIQHFTWNIYESPEEMFQDGSFVFTILSKLQNIGALRNDIDIYQYFVDCENVEKCRYNLESICRMYD